MGGSRLALEVFWWRNGGLEMRVGKNLGNFELGRKSTVEFGGGFAEATLLIVLCSLFHFTDRKQRKREGSIILHNSAHKIYIIFKKIVKISLNSRTGL